MTSPGAKYAVDPGFLDALIAAGDDAQQSVAADNGFASLSDMIAAHAPIVEAVVSRTAGRPCRVLDLGCGNGFLLAELCRAAPGISPVGIERCARRLERAHALFGGANVELHPGDLFACREAWPRGRRYDVALLMPGRLIDASPDSARTLRRYLAKRVGTVFGYAYPDWLERFGDIASLCEAADLIPVGPVVTGAGSALVEVRIAQ